jgi:hypothetical protein
VALGWTIAGTCTGAWVALTGPPLTRAVMKNATLPTIMTQMSSRTAKHPTNHGFHPRMKMFLRAETTISG